MPPLKKEICCVSCVKVNVVFCNNVARAIFPSRRRERWIGRDTADGRGRSPRRAEKRERKIVVLFCEYLNIAWIFFLTFFLYVPSSRRCLRSEEHQRVPSETERRKRKRKRAAWPLPKAIRSSGGGSRSISDRNYFRIHQIIYFYPRAIPSFLLAVGVVRFRGEFTG